MTEQRGIVVDAVIHGYNMLESNFRSKRSRGMKAAFYGVLQMSGDARYITSEQYCRDWSIEDLAELLFVESEADLAVYHGVPLDDYFFDGLSSNAKGIEMAKRWPDRVKFYGAINPLEGRSALDKVDHFVKECGAIGIKLYPERYTEGVGAVPVALDSKAVAPLLQKLVELGVPLAIHKFSPAGFGLTDHYRCGDVEAAASLYPDLRIEVVHSGVAFLEEAAFMLARYPNVWANLEYTSSLAVSTPRKFAEAIGLLMASGASRRLIFASGCVLVHPQPIIEAIRAFRMPQDLIENYHYWQPSPAEIEGWLGGNWSRMHGLDPAQALAAIQDDEFARRRAEFSGELWSSAIHPEAG